MLSTLTLPKTFKSNPQKLWLCRVAWTVVVKLADAQSTDLKTGLVSYTIQVDLMSSPGSLKGEEGGRRASVRAE